MVDSLGLKPPRPKKDRDDIGKIADIIYNMKYKDLTSLGRQLFAMTQLEDGKELWNLTTETDWPELLHTWAESIGD